jgi:hypothetical protein
MRRDALGDPALVRPTAGAFTSDRLSAIGGRVPTSPAGQATYRASDPWNADGRIDCS